MWPDLFGPGYQWGLLAAATIMAASAAFLAVAMRGARPLEPDPVADVWHRYEQGDLTSWEGARLFRSVGPVPAGAAAQTADVERVPGRAIMGAGALGERAMRRLVAAGATDEPRVL